jgi:hypothetical protein
VNRALARRPAYMQVRSPQGLGVTYSAQALPSSFSAGGSTLATQQAQAAQSAPTSGTTYILAGAATTLALGVLIYLATR